MSAEDAPRRHRAHGQLLHATEQRTAAQVVGHLLAVQAQDPRAARLALRARTAGLSAADVDAALNARELVVAWLNRGTLHLVRSEDHAWLLQLTAPRRTAANARRLTQEGVPPDHAERATAVIERVLLDEGPRTRAELGDRIAAHGVRIAGQALPHLLFRACLHGIAVLGPVEDRVQRFVAVRDWLGPPTRPAPRETVLEELARRYRAAHAAAEPEDLAHWAGIGLTEARAGFAATREQPDDDLPDPVPPRLLPAFDPYLLGWRDRAFAVPPALRTRVHPGGGILRPTATDDGCATGTWSLRAGRARIDAPGDFEAEAADVARFLG